MCCGSGLILGRVGELFYEATLLKGTMKAEQEIGKEFSRRVSKASKRRFHCGSWSVGTNEKKKKVHEQAEKLRNKFVIQELGYAELWKPNNEFDFFF